MDNQAGCRRGRSCSTDQTITLCMIIDESIDNPQCCIEKHWKLQHLFTYTYLFTARQMRFTRVYVLLLQAIWIPWSDAASVNLHIYGANSFATSLFNLNTIYQIVLARFTYNILHQLSPVTAYRRSVDSTAVAYNERRNGLWPYVSLTGAYLVEDQLERTCCGHQNVFSQTDGICSMGQKQI